METFRPELKVPTTSTVYTTNSLGDICPILEAVGGVNVGLNPAP